MAEWKQVATLGEFATNDRKFVEVGLEEIALFKSPDGQIHALSPWCTHQRVSMMNGWIEGTEIVCPLHGARFDLKTGQNLCAPAPRPLVSYPLKIENGLIYVEV